MNKREKLTKWFWDDYIEDASDFVETGILYTVSALIGIIAFPFWLLSKIFRRE
jgi:hypothetical protein